MIKIKFNNSTALHECEFSRINDHVVTLGKRTVENTSGFCTYRMSGEQLGDFSDYDTVYRLLENAVQYSNDGSVYVEPEPEPEHKPSISLEERITDLETALCEIMDSMA